MNTKKWLVPILSAFILIASLVYYGLQHPYEELVVEKLGEVHRFSVTPRKDNNNKVVLKVDGFSNCGYSVKMDFQYGQGNSGPLGTSDTIMIPHGNIKGTWVSDFYGAPGKDQVVITYIPPRDKRGLNGHIKIRAFID